MVGYRQIALVAGALMLLVVAYVRHESYRMKSLGETTAQDFVWVWELRDGKIVSFREFFDTEKLAHDLSD